MRLRLIEPLKGWTFQTLFNLNAIAKKEITIKAYGCTAPERSMVEQAIEGWETFAKSKEQFARETLVTPAAVEVIPEFLLRGTHRLDARSSDCNESEKLSRRLADSLKEHLVCVQR
ncbi:hypothetical protein Poly51_09200 [Rubripirellula tenax]|uniref:Uncharacterized protein n=1 Tax=Rubripirellula tenax TaxID=2528015 RepID=A0A5C6FGM5_9BACT|nr:hypothetical protein [Rubripirellula tenax]TWU60641.1 hypothetical protein Poly51_09200 [Rubripirellula tenax]